MITRRYVGDINYMWHLLFTRVRINIKRVEKQLLNNMYRTVFSFPPNNRKRLENFYTEANQRE